VSTIERTITEEGRYPFIEPGNVYLEFVDPTRNSRKSYSIELRQDGDKYIIFRSWGRIGKQSQGLEHNHALLATALKEANSKYREKLRKGYIQRERPWSHGYLDFIKRDYQGPDSVAKT
jgi:predicted DNA-binding WGR domain protein